MSRRIFLSVVMLGACSSPKEQVARFNCIVTVHDGSISGHTAGEILCFEPSGLMFRPEKRFDRFILEVPATGANNK